MQVEPTTERGSELVVFFSQPASAVAASMVKSVSGCHELPPPINGELLSLLLGELKIEPAERWTSFQVAEYMAHAFASGSTDLPDGDAEAAHKAASSSSSGGGRGSGLTAAPRRPTGDAAGAEAWRSVPAEK